MVCSAWSQWSGKASFGGASPWLLQHNFIVGSRLLESSCSPIRLFLHKNNIALSRWISLLAALLPSLWKLLSFLQQDKPPLRMLSTISAQAHGLVLFIERANAYLRWHLFDSRRRLAPTLRSRRERPWPDICHSIQALQSL